MNDRSAALDAAVRAQGKLIAEAQRLLTAYVETKRVHPDAVINDLLWLLDGPRQREAQRLVREALGDDPGIVAQARSPGRRPEAVSLCCRAKAKCGNVS